MQYKNSFFIIFFFVLSDYKLESIDSSVTTVIAHGLGSCGKKVKNFMSCLALEGNVIAPNFADAGIVRAKGLCDIISIMSNKCFFGQYKDALSLISSLPEQYDTLIGLGHCRGALSLIHAATDVDFDALVLRGLPISISKALTESIFVSSSMEAIVKKILQRKTQFDVSCSHGLEVVHQINNKNMVIVLMHHTNDRFVPFEHALLWYEAFKKAGFKNIYLIPIESGAHGTPPTVQEVSIVQSIYAVHGLLEDIDGKLSNIDVFQYQFTKKQINVLRKKYIPSNILRPFLFLREGFRYIVKKVTSDSAKSIDMRHIIKSSSEQDRQVVIELFEQKGLGDIIQQFLDNAVTFKVDTVDIADLIALRFQLSTKKQKKCFLAFCWELFDLSYDEQNLIKIALKMLDT